MLHACLILAMAQPMPIWGRSTCCAFFDSSQPFEGLETREQVRDRYGWRLTGGLDKGRRFDEVRHHGSVKTFKFGNMGRAMFIGMTLGLSELVLIPCDLCVTGRDAFIGHKVRFYYDEQNRVTSYLVDGQYYQLRQPAGSSEHVPKCERHDSLPNPPM